MKGKKNDWLNLDLFQISLATSLSLSRFPVTRTLSLESLKNVYMLFYYLVLLPAIAAGIVGVVKWDQVFGTNLCCIQASK